MRRRLRARSAIVIATLLSILMLPGARADHEEGPEIGFMIGAFAAEKELTFDSGSTGPVLGMRFGRVYSDHWGWFVDGLVTRLDSRFGDADAVIARTGFEYMFAPASPRRPFVNLGLGWMVVNYDGVGSVDNHNPIGSIGFGQRIFLRDDCRLRWEVRADRTLDDARLTGDATQLMGLIGLNFGPGTTIGKKEPTPRKAKAPRKKKEPKTQPTPEPVEPEETKIETSPASEVARGDEDEDGIRNRRDRCPGTPQGVVVDADGCPLDDDLDGVANGADACPGTRRGVSVDARGCPPDQDGDGVADMSDFCSDTPGQAQVDEWGCPKDSDGDGIYNGIDRCANTPARAEVDANGCATDDDGDGVYDGIDACPDTNADTTIDDRGCPIGGGTPPDTDGDGVPDSSDVCPQTPAGSPVDERGCPAKPPPPTAPLPPADEDADGVPDGTDACPATPKGSPVDVRGCPPRAPASSTAAEFKSGATKIILEGVRFVSGSAELTEPSRTVLDRVSNEIRDQDELYLEIGGHTDSAGDPEKNRQLSELRAQAVKDYMLSWGVPAQRLRVKGYGKTQPVADNASDEGRSRNRRVELKRVEP